MSGHTTSLISLFAASASIALLFGSAARAEAPRISGPYTHENLSIYLLHGKDADSAVPLTLDEALAKGSVKVHETGTVAALEIENTGDEEIFVHAGDIVKGGQQDRVVTASLALKAKSGRVPLAVFCVERGRWAPRGIEDSKLFASAKEMMPSREAKLAMREGAIQTAAAAAAPVARAELPDTLGAVAEQSATRGDRTDDLNIAQRQREDRTNRARRPDTQGEVWANVDKIQQRLSKKVEATVNSAESQSSLQLALEHDKLALAQKKYIDALAGIVEAHPDVIGYAFAIDGNLNSADVYASNGLFKKLWPKLVKAAATEALGSEAEGAPAAAPATADVEAFLKDAEGGELSEQASIDGQKLATRAAKSSLDSVTVRASGTMLHRNVLKR